MSIDALSFEDELLITEGASEILGSLGWRVFEKNGSYYTMAVVDGHHTLSPPFKTKREALKTSMEFAAIVAQVSATFSLSFLLAIKDHLRKQVDSINADQKINDSLENQKPDWLAKVMGKG